MEETFDITFVSEFRANFEKIPSNVIQLKN